VIDWSIYGKKISWKLATFGDQPHIHSKMGLYPRG
jgi:hypothetical protein